MNALMTLSRQTKHLVGFAAVVATLFTLGGTLGLAEHYAHSSGAGHDYLAGNPGTQAAQAVGKQMQHPGTIG